MESINLEMEDIFGAGETNPEDLGAEQNPVESTENQEDENTFDANVSAKLAKGAAKKVVRNPQPKLDPQRLSSQRGIAILPKLFENVKFKGKGYEAQDLEKVIKGLEHWAHRLFPKKTFDECLQTIEKLGNRREVKSCIKKIRLDMPVLDEDFVSKPEEVMGNSEDISNMDEITEAEQAFDRMMQSPTSSQFTSPLNSPGGLLPSSQPNSSSKSKTVISDELKEKIERNRRLALERRTQKLQNQAPHNQITSDAIPSTQEEEKESLDTETEMNATKKQCKTLAAAVETLDDNEENIASDKSKSVDSGDNAEKESTINIDACDDKTSPIPANQDSVSLAVDEKCSDETMLVTPSCDKSIEMDTEKDLGVKTSPIQSNQGSVSLAADEKCSDERMVVTPSCDKSIEMDTDKDLGAKTSPIQSNQESISLAVDEKCSNEKIATPSSDRFFEMDTYEDLGDKTSPIPANQDSISLAADEKYSDEKKIATPSCDKSIEMDTDKDLGVKTSPIQSNQESVSLAVDEKCSDERMVVTPSCDKSIEMDTDKDLGAKTSPIQSNQESVSLAVDEKCSNEKKIATPSCDKLFEMDTYEDLGDKTSPIPANQNSISLAADEKCSDEKKIATPSSDRFFEMDTYEDLGDKTSPIPANQDSVSLAADEECSDETKVVTPSCDKSFDV